MDIIAQLKAERDKAVQQLNALDTAIRALSGFNSTGATRGRREVKSFYANQYPELTTAAISGPEIIGNSIQYAFSRAIGTKG